MNLPRIADYLELFLIIVLGKMFFNLVLILKYLRFDLINKGII